MSTDGTLYDETVKNGFAKLLSAQTVTTPVPAIDFVAPLSASLDYRTFWFDLDSLYADNSTSSYLIIRTSLDSGATWAPNGYWWTLLNIWSHNNYQAWGSVYQGWDTYLQVGGNPQYGPLPLSGRVYFGRGSVAEGGVKQFHFQIVDRDPTYGMLTCFGGGGYAGSHAINGVRFQYLGAGINFTAGTIRCYGLKKGI